MLLNAKRIIARAVSFGIMALLSPLVPAYMIENQGETATFYGQFCAACWHGTIPSGESSGCPGRPGRNPGCDNTTWIYKYMGVYSQNEKNIECYVMANKPVTEFGRVVFTTSEIFVYDDADTLIDRGGYNYWHLDTSGLFASGCPGRPV